jgi:hypothetical protein
MRFDFPHTHDVQETAKNHKKGRPKKKKKKKQMTHPTTVRGIIYSFFKNDEERWKEIKGCFSTFGGKNACALAQSSRSTHANATAAPIKELSLAGTRPILRGSARLLLAINSSKYRWQLAR